MELYWHGEKVADMPIAPVSEEAPMLERPTKRPAYLDTIGDKTIDDFASVPNQEAFEKLIASLEVSDKAWVYNQYDSMVQTNTAKHPGSLDASVIRIKETGKALAMSSDCNPRYCYIDPHKGAALAVVEAGRNVAMSGARPLAITDCLNYGNPEDPEVMWQFAQGCEGIKEACKALETPVVSGNVSLYNETNGQSVHPTPAIATVGVNESADRVLPSSFQQAGNAIVLVGKTTGVFGGSLYLKELFDATVGTLNDIDYDQELGLWQLVIDANTQGLLESAKDVNVGGIAIALAKMAAVGSLGADASVALDDGRWIFDESQSRALLEVQPQNLESVVQMAQKLGLEIEQIGTVGGDSVTLNDVSLPLEKLKTIYFTHFAEVVEQDL
jgi:phosphoribosylformylglycinamidine synthase